MQSEKTNFSHRGFCYHHKFNMTEDGRIIFQHDITKKNEPSNVVFVYWGITDRPLNEDEFKSYVDQMIRVTESGY